MLLWPWSSVGTAAGCCGCGIGGKGGRFKSGACDETEESTGCEADVGEPAFCEPAACCNKLTIDEMSGRSEIKPSRAASGEAALAAPADPEENNEVPGRPVARASGEADEPARPPSAKFRIFILPVCDARLR